MERGRRGKARIRAEEVEMGTSNPRSSALSALSVFYCFPQAFGWFLLTVLTSTGLLHADGASDLQAAIKEGIALRKDGKWLEALKQFETAANIAAQVYGPDQPGVVPSLTHQADVHYLL